MKYWCEYWNLVTAFGGTFGQATEEQVRRAVLELVALGEDEHGRIWIAAQRGARLQTLEIDRRGFVMCEEREDEDDMLPIRVEEDEVGDEDEMVALFMQFLVGGISGVFGPA